MRDFDDSIASGERNGESENGLSAAARLFADAFDFKMADAFRQRYDRNENRTQRTERTESNLEHSDLKSSKPKDSWTMVVQLDSEGPDSTDKLKQLKELAADSKGKQVTIVVQCAKGEGDNRQIERYVIRDGKISQLKDAKSEGIAQDMKDLLQYATKNFPSEKLGLVLHAHGHGNLGVGGQLGKDYTSIESLADSIKSGLKDSGHAKLDLINFDSCVMGQNGVLNKLRKVTDHVVASPQAVPFGPEGQSIASTLKALFSNPSMDGDKLADQFVKDAKKQAESSTKPDEAIKTLSHYDLGAYPRFNDALNELGTQLMKAMGNEKNRELIKELIKKTRDMDEGNDTDRPHSVSFNAKRDLKDFTRKLLEAIDSGKLEADPKLKDAVVGVMAAQEKLVKSYFGRQNNRELGGLTVYLPEKATLDVERIAGWWTPDGRLGKLTSTSADKLDSRDDREKLVRRLEGDLDIARDMAKKDKTANGTMADDRTRKLIEDMEKQLKELEKNQGNKDRFMATLKELKANASRLSDTEFFRAHRKDARKSATSKIRGELISGGEWQRFREKLLSSLS